MSEADEFHIVELEEAAQALINRGGVPGLLDAAENVVIVHDMGGDIDDVIAALRMAIDL